MSAGLLVVVVLVLGVLLVVPLVVGLVAWAVLRPGAGEPAGRGRLRRTSGTTTATATAVALVPLVPAAVLALGAPVVAAAVVPLAGLLHVAVLWTGEALASRPPAVRRTALLAPEPPTPLRPVLLGLLVGSVLGLLALLAAAQLQGPDPVLDVPRNSTLLAVVPAVVLAALVLLACRQVARRAQDARVDPRVDAAGRARAGHRLLRAGAAGTAATLGLVLLGPDLRGGLATGDTVAVVALVAGGLLLLGSAAVCLLPPPALPMHPDPQPDPRPDPEPGPSHRQRGPDTDREAPVGTGAGAD